MRLLLVGAFPYPHHQGSQVYFQEQAIALRAAGAEVVLLTYGPADDAPLADLDRWRALDGFVHHTIPRDARPRSAASGPSLAKPRADLALRRTLLDAIASKRAEGASFDVIMTHNIEACVIALSLRRALVNARVPIVYCVHTLLRHELSAYLKPFQNNHLEMDAGDWNPMPGRVRRVIDGVGRRLDAFAAAQVDGWIALTQSAERVMQTRRRAPGRVIPPPLPDPRHRFFDEPTGRRIPSEPYFLYAGNLDGYQELPLLEAAARRLATHSASPRIVLASFDPAVAAPERGWAPGIEPRHVTSEGEMQALAAQARATLVPRLAVGGFPIKLANSLAVGTPS
ncbi:MAG: glycosyltransferase, partial [Myxococcota bacterium]